MVSTQIHAKNHFVPKSYLKQWVTDNGKLFVYKTLVSHRDVPLWKPKAPKEICKIKHFYTDTSNGYESDDLERWLDREFENPASKVIEKVISDSRMDINDWCILVNYLAAQDVRNPKRFFFHTELYKEHMPSIYEETIKSFDNNFKSNCNKNKYLGEIPLKLTPIIDHNATKGVLKVETFPERSNYIKSIKNLLSNTSKQLHSHKWSILKPAKGYHWFTSDNPVIRLNYNGYNSYDLKGGWNNNGANIFMPLSPKHLLFAQAGKKPPRRNTIVSIEKTLEIRKFIAENCYRAIFSNIQDLDVENLKPRIIDKDKYKEEQEYWQKHHNIQKKN